MVPFKQKYSDIFAEYEGPSPKIGPDHQAEILSNSDQLSPQMSPAYSEEVHDKSLSSSICLPISVAWSDADAESLVLGLFIYGKNFTQIKKFLENKEMGEILSFYYGKFYKSDGYQRWSECRKLKGTKRMIGKKLPTKMRQHELLSRLNPDVSKESQHTLSKVSKSYVEGKTSLEEYISSMKSIVGLGIFAQAVGIGKENGVLTRFDMEPRKNSCEEFSAPACQALSSFGPGDIIQSLTGGFRLSKTRTDELFWEAVWPRLLARGWHSEQPKNQCYVTSKDYLVFLIPGVEKFSRRKLLKGKHYFDSVRDVLSKVVAEPNIIVLEEEISNEDDFSDDHRQCYLKPRSSTYNKDQTCLLDGGKPSYLRELKYVSSNTVHTIEVDVDGKRYKGNKYTRKVNLSKDVPKSIKQSSAKLTANRLPERKLLTVKQKRYLPVELEDASTLTTNLLSEIKGGSSTDDSPKLVEAKIPIYGRKKIDKTDSCTVVSNNVVCGKKEARYNPHNDANKMVESQKNQNTCVFDDRKLKRIIKHQFNWRVRSGDSNHTVVHTKRRRLTACAKAENSSIIENFSGGLRSDKLGFPCSFSFLEANPNVCDPVCRQQNGSSTVLSKDICGEENNEKGNRNDSFQCMSVSCVEVEKSEPFNCSVPQVPSMSENSKTMATAEEGEQDLMSKDPCSTSAAATEEVVEEPVRRQSSRKGKLTVKALESLANELWHVQKRLEKNNVQTHADIFNSVRKPRTRGKTRPRRHFLDHWNASEVGKVKEL